MALGNFVSNSIRDAIQQAVGATGASKGGSGQQGVLPVSEYTDGGSTDPGGYGGGYGGYGGGGGGGGSSGPSDTERKAFDNLGALTGYNADTLKGQYEDQMRVYDVADQMNQSLRDENVLQAKQKAGTDWFRQHLKLQRTASALNDRSGNAMRGSYLYDYRDLLGAADDNIDSETLDTMRENINSTLLSYFESKMDDVNNRNQAALNTEQGLRELYADYIAQGNNIDPDLVAGQIDAANHTLKNNSWLQTDWFDSHLQQAATPDRQDLFRPDRANSQARENGLNSSGYNTASSAIGSYWDRMNRGYDQRERQA